jgi:prophage antirepressor-like protein
MKKDDLIKFHQEYDKEVNDCFDETKIEENKTLEENNETLEVFNFNDNVIRTFGTYEDPFFVLKDIADILELTNYRNVYSKMDDYMKGVRKLDTLGGLQNMQVINEAGLYYMIIKSTKPIAKEFQKLVFNEILPTIRKKGVYKLENQSKMILQRPIRQILSLSDIDVEAEELEMSFDMSLYSNKTVIYLAYIGKNLVKLGFSDKRLNKREEKHTSCESQFDQFRFIKAFEVSGQPIEKIIKDMLKVYNIKYHLQSEIYKPPSSLKNFIEIISNLLNEHDLKFQLDNLLLKYKEI